MNYADKIQTDYENAIKSNREKLMEDARNLSVNIRLSSRKLINALRYATYQTVLLIRSLRDVPECRKARNKARYERMTKRRRQS